MSPGKRGPGRPKKDLEGEKRDERLALVFTADEIRIIRVAAAQAGYAHPRDWARTKLLEAAEGAVG